MCISSFWRVGFAIYGSYSEAQSAARAIKELTGEVAVVSQFSSKGAGWVAAKPGPARSRSGAPPIAPHK